MEICLGCPNVIFENEKLELSVGLNIILVVILNNGGHLGFNDEKSQFCKLAKWVNIKGFGGNFSHKVNKIAS